MEYQGFEALVQIQTGPVSKGKLPRKVAAIVQEWGLAHQRELLANWERAQRFEPLERIQGADPDEAVGSPLRGRSSNRTGLFSDGRRGVFDVDAYLTTRQGSLLEPLYDETYLQRFFIDAGALGWPNGLELSPARLHEISLLEIAA